MFEYEFRNIRYNNKLFEFKINTNHALDRINLKFKISGQILNGWEAKLIFVNIVELSFNSFNVIKGFEENKKPV